jgi:hypothetical protein
VRYCRRETRLWAALSDVAGSDIANEADFEIFSRSQWRWRSDLRHKIVVLKVPISLVTRCNASGGVPSAFSGAVLGVATRREVRCRVGLLLGLQRSGSARADA